MGCHKGKTIPDFPPKPVNSFYWGMRHVEALRCSLYKNSLPERGFCSMVLFFIVAPEWDHPLNELMLLLGITV